MSKGTVIETERVRLRTWRNSDADEFDRHCNTPRVMRWLGGVQTRHQLQDDVDYFIECQATHGHTFWLMERKTDCAFLGFLRSRSRSGKRQHSL